MKKKAVCHRAQRGMTLIELLVGIAIGLMVVAVAGGALMVSRGVSGTVSDASNINQQAAYAMRTIGLQLRQTGSLRLNLNSSGANAMNAATAPVAFEKKSEGSSNPLFDFDLSQPGSQLMGTNNSLTTRFQRDFDPVDPNKFKLYATDASTLARNCVGGPSDDASQPSASHQLIQSVFAIDGNNQLTCSGNGAVPAQPIIDHVANFQLRYLVQTASGSALGNPTVEYVNAAAVTNWGQVQAVEVCLVLYGNETIGLPAGSSYTDCDGTTQIDMTTLSGSDSQRRNRMHKVFRNVFQLRSQGLLGSVL